MEKKNTWLKKLTTNLSIDTQILKDAEGENCKPIYNAIRRRQTTDHVPKILCFSDPHSAEL